MHAISSAKRHYYQNKVRHLKTKDPAGWHRQIKLLTQGRRDQPPITVPGVDCNGQFEHVANLINNHFISIAKDIPSIDRSLLPPYLPSPMPCPHVQPREVYKEIRQLKTNKSSISGDLPVRILREFAYELSFPLTDILNTSFDQAKVPEQWKCAEVVPIPKTNPPTIAELRPIALTSCFAKIAETFVAKWLLDDVAGKIDFNQFGNQRKLSTCRYLVKLLHQLYENADNPK